MNCWSHISLHTPVGFVAIFDAFQQSVGFVVCGTNCSKALSKVHLLMWLPVNFKPGCSSKNQDVCRNCMHGFIIHKAS